MKKKKYKDIEYEIGSDNIFADLGIPNPEEALAKSQLVWKISKIIKKRKLTQAKVAKILKIKQPKVSLLLRGYLKSFSLERLLRFLNDLGQDIVISVKPSSRHGTGSTMIGDSPSKASIAALAK
jgi:predicted XRE-type DNA-binding protein